jgi:hypothetical protein
MTEVEIVSEVYSVAAETLALQTVLIALLSRLAVHDPSLQSVIAASFDEAANFVEDATIQAGSAAPPEHLAHSLRVIEELRAATLGDHERPKYFVQLG